MIQNADSTFILIIHPIYCGLDVHKKNVPDKDICKWRELTRRRKTYTKSLADYKQRIHKVSGATGQFKVYRFQF